MLPDSDDGRGLAIDGTQPDMTIAARLPEFDRRIADGLIAANDHADGLPRFLGVRITSIEPGLLRAELEVTPQLLTHFGFAHGGVLSALCDHVLGCVCYPHMKPGQWAATRALQDTYLRQSQDPARPSSAKNPTLLDS